MTLSFALIALLTVVAALAAMLLRNLVHCALAMVVAFVGIAAAFLNLDAQFVGFAQILVYVGAVTILIVFAVLLTRGGLAPERSLFSTSWVWGGGVAVAVFATLAWAIRQSVIRDRQPLPEPDVTVKQIGEALMTRFVLPLEVIGLLLTAALIGAVIIAMKEAPAGGKREKESADLEEPGNPPSVMPPPTPEGGLS